MACNCPEGEGSRCFYRACHKEGKPWPVDGTPRPCPFIGCRGYRTERIVVEHGNRRKVASACPQHVHIRALKYMNRIGGIEAAAALAREFFA